MAARGSSTSPPLAVVSSDSHVGPLPGQLREYCPAGLLDAFDAEVEKNSRRATISRAKIELAELGVSRRSGGAIETRDPFRNRRTAGHHDSAARLADMDRDGVAASVIFHGSQNGHVIPFVDFVSSFYGAIPSADRQDRELEGRRIYNRWLADFCAEAPNRHIGLCQIPVWDLDASIGEVRWASDHGLRGVHFPANTVGVPSFEDPVWDPFFAECAERGMTLSTHISGAEQIDPGYKGPGVWGIRALEGPLLGRRTIWLLIFAGVFDRHPDLRFVVTEVPGAWWGELVREMDAAYFSWHGRRSLQSFLAMKPSEYAHRNVWVGASFASRAEAAEAVGNSAEGRLMWGSDYPHTEGTWTFSEDRSEPSVTRLSLANTFHDLGEEAIRRMVGGNAVDCYSLDRSAVDEIARRVGPSLEEVSTPPDLSAVPDHYQGYGFRTRGAWS